MKKFIPSDPPEYESPKSVAHHEAGHAFMAYYYGFRIGPFTTARFDESLLTGVFSNGPNLDLVNDNEEEAVRGKVQQLQAGELGCRIFNDLPLDEVVFPNYIQIDLDNLSNLHNIAHHKLFIHEHDAHKCLGYME